jgi:hypothetical protein
MLALLDLDRVELDLQQVPLKTQSHRCSWICDRATGLRYIHIEDLLAVDFAKIRLGAQRRNQPISCLAACQNGVGDDRPYQTVATPYLRDVRTIMDDQLPLESVR